MQLPQQFGPYLLEELIARGGMAEVFRASMAGVGAFQKTVAIKKILPHLAADEGFVSMLIGEAQIIVNVNHANIAQVIDLGKIDDTYYIAMEFIQGVDLANILTDLEAQNARLPIEHALWITRCVLSGLNHAHQATDQTGRPLNIVHRDVSPHNVLVSFGGDVKIIDFGVAKVRGMDNTKEGVIKGKLLYMAPEQAMAERVDNRADLFAVGVVMYRMLTGQLPFQGDNEFQIYNNIVSHDITSPAQLTGGIPAEVDRIVMRLLEREPSQRYQDGYSAAIDIDRALQALSPGYSVSRFSRHIEDNFSHLMRRRLLDSGLNEFGIPKTPIPSTPQTHERPVLNDADRERVREMQAHSGTPQGHAMNPQNSSSSDWRTQNPGLTETGPIQNPRPPAKKKGPSLAIPVILTLLFWLATGGLLAYELQFKNKTASALPAAQTEGDTEPVAAKAEKAIAEVAEPTKEAEPEPVAAERVTVEITSKPAAILTIDGEEVGETPFQMQTAKGETPIAIKLELDGYETKELEIAPTEDIKEEITMTSLEQKEEPKPAEEKPKSKSTAKSETKPTGATASTKSKADKKTTGGNKPKADKKPTGGKKPKADKKPRDKPEPKPKPRQTIDLFEL